jgi:hypothetical protein
MLHRVSIDAPLLTVVLLSQIKTRLVGCHSGRCSIRPRGERQLIHDVISAVYVEGLTGDKPRRVVG